MLLIVSLTFLSLAYAAPHPRQASSPTVTIDSGVVVGVQTLVSNSPNLVNKFLGIPFAASPTRFSPPQLPTPWTQPFQATQNGPACIQVRDQYRSLSWGHRDPNPGVWWETPRYKTILDLQRQSDVSQKRFIDT